jgi:hypothetical protein
MPLEGLAARCQSRRQRVAIDGVWHLIIPLDSMEGIAWDAAGSIEYPSPAPGWAISHIGNVRYAAWFGGGRDA